MPQKTLYSLLGFLALTLTQIICAKESLRVTLIGTGVPPVNPERGGSCVLVEAGKHKMLFDVGRGASMNLARHGLKLAEIDQIFLTHLHGDHTTGLFDLWVSSYHRSNGPRLGPLKMVGPPGTKTLTAGLTSAAGEIMHEWRIPLENNYGFEVREINEDSLVFQDGDLIVKAFRVEHGKHESFGYKIQYGDYSAVISGDTGYSKNLIEHARDVDLLVHEVFDPINGIDIIVAEGGYEYLLTIHSTPEVAAKVFSEANPKIAVGYHLKKSSEELEMRMKPFYSGKFFGGKDLMSFTIGEEILIEQK